MFKLIVANRFSQESLVHLQKSGLVQLTTCENISDSKAQWPECEGLLIRSGVQVTPELLTQMPKLRVIISAASGFDHIHLDACRDRNICVMHTPEANAQSAAEHTMGLLIATQRCYNRALKQIESGRWERGALLGEELQGKTLGLIGLGRIGSRVKKMAQAFGLQVLVHDPYTEQKNHPDTLFLGFEEVVRKSDVVSFHVPLTSETYHMIKASTLEWFHESATLINASRGDVICFSSLLNHLIENPQFRLGLDVYAAEPLDKNSALLEHPQIFCTPHIGATTYQAISRASLEAAHKLLLFIQTGQSSDTLPPSTLWADKLIY
jgi:D-3-phosphoglycerate dehydrogenase / 2-oxoglutarate reductase